MNFKKLVSEDSERGVSPVIGVILMVAITVILAAVIGAFVLGLGDQVSNNAPQASFGFDFEEDATNRNVTITHDGGDDIDQSAIKVTIDGQEEYPTTNTFTQVGSGFSDPITTGDSVELSIGESNIDGGETVRVIWENPSGGSSNTLAERDWPT